MSDRPIQRKRKKDEYRVRTHLIHGNFDSKKWDYNHHVVPPMSSSATYRLDSAHRGAQGFFEFANEATDFTKHAPIYIYERLEEPTRGMLEENLAYAESGETCVTFATGMAAISGLLSMLCKNGDEIVAHEILYGCTYSLVTNWLPRFGVQTKFANLQNESELRKAITYKTRAVYFETPVNPDLTIIDIAAVRRVVDEINADRPPERQLQIVVDNTFATPYCQRPLSHGAHYSVFSLTKGIGGFGTDMGGAVVGPKKTYGQLMLYRKDFGGVLSPKSAWPFLVYGLPTLSTRVINQQKTALRVAHFLQEHPKVERVAYPGLESHPQYELAKRQMVNYEGKFSPGSMIYFLLKSDPSGNSASQRASASLHNINKAAEQGEKFIDYIAERAYSITLAVSLGQIKTLIESPFSMTHSALPEEEKRKAGMEPGGIRLAIGLEDWHDIIEDLQEALDQI